MTIPEAHSVLVENNIFGAPVWDAPSSRYIGTLDMGDIVELFLTRTRLTDACAIADARERALKIAEVVASEDLPQTIEDVARSKPFVFVVENARMDVVAEALAQGVHMIAVLGNNGRVGSVITQSSVLKWLHSNVDHLPDRLDSNVNELPLVLGSAPVTTVDVRDTVEHAFRLMREGPTHFSGLPVVNKELDGIIVGNLSLRDIREFGVHADRIPLMHETVGHFLSHIHSREIEVHCPAVCVSETTTLANVINRLAISRIHRVYLCDASHHPTRAITLSDVLRAVMGEERPVIQEITNADVISK
eukprot:TRINITY_DN13861_c0_g1_i1.p1 TRINITY_DN13861_c0_g1~~TRINITY_DN13861_c0_g1_i1.p1  ORF type:complete len:312 (+),score=82.93 TRINITY_DN13861_c0_g1_i1:25-936(+)